MNNIKTFDDFVNEGLFDFLKSDTIDFTKEDKPQDKSKEKTGISRWAEYLKDKEYRDFTKSDKKKSKPVDKKIPPRPYYGVQEEEEEEAPYKKVVRRSNDYWSDENVRMREARKRKTTTARNTK